MCDVVVATESSIGYRWSLNSLLTEQQCVSLSHTMDTDTGVGLGLGLRLVVLAVYLYSI